MNYLDHTFAVILAGGGGTRLWPKSRIQTPKQLLKLVGERTMLQVTADRFAKFIPWEKIIIVTTKRYEKQIGEQLPAVKKINIIAEPEKRDTALAMLVGAVYAKLKDPKAIVVNDAADHVVEDETEFIKLMKSAAKVASNYQNLVAVGIKPAYPSTAFGYIKIGEEIDALANAVRVFKVRNFTEKPKRATAQAFISTGKYFWNANHYVWSSDALIAAFAKYKPETCQLIQPLLKSKLAQFKSLLPAVYQPADSISIDYAISEKADNLLLIPGDFGWNDIGEWQVVYDLGKKDPAGNVVISDKKHTHAPTLTIESQNNLIHTDGRLITLLGVNDMIVIDTPEIILVAPKTKSQEVKKIIEQLKKEKADKYL